MPHSFRAAPAYLSERGTRALSPTLGQQLPLLHLVTDAWTRSVVLRNRRHCGGSGRRQVESPSQSQPKLPVFLIIDRFANLEQGIEVLNYTRAVKSRVSRARTRLFGAARPRQPRQVRSGPRDAGCFDRGRARPIGRRTLWRDGLSFKRRRQGRQGDDMDRSRRGRLLRRPL